MSLIAVDLRTSSIKVAANLVDGTRLWKSLYAQTMDIAHAPGAGS